MRRKAWLAAGLALAVGVPAILAQGAPAPDWPRYRGPRADGTSRETGLLKSWGDWPACCSKLTTTSRLKSTLPTASASFTVN